MSALETSQPAQLVREGLMALEETRNHNSLESLFRDYGIPFPPPGGRERRGGVSSVPGRVRENVAIEDMGTSGRALALTALRFCGFEDD